MTRVRANQSTWATASIQNRNALEKASFRLCFDAIGSEGLKNIMRSNLMSLLQGNVISASLSTYIDSISERFKDICMKHVN